MTQKDKILDAWIMVEHLAEGDINLKDKTIITFGQLQNENYYDLFLREIQKKKMKPYQDGGIVLYFDIFPFKEVVDFLREKYHLKPAEEERAYGDKFSFALYFDKKLKLNREMTFLTESYYIRKNKKIPEEREFSAFEEEFKKRVEERFDYSGDEYEAYFNKVIASILQKNNISIKNCRMKAVLNLKTDATNLHSFFVGDLEKAKEISYDMLDSYILGKPKKRIDLDSRLQSGKGNGDIFNQILQPQNYPMARFPGNPEYALAFMQQVAVNLAICNDNEQMKSVNGPPGTGKTTLLKDIFAELFVEQAHEIVNLPEKFIKGSEKTKYWENASIGIMPEKIAEKGIVVASSNNGAVQNIVNELPLISGIYEEFAEDIVAADYFRSIANSVVKAKWVKDENGALHEQLISEEREESDRFWGLFSLEGGRKDNMDYMVTVLKHVVKYFEDEYISDERIYEEFKKQYEAVYAYRKERQGICEKINTLDQLVKKIEEKRRLYNMEEVERQERLSESNFKIEEDINNIQHRTGDLETALQDDNAQLRKVQDDKDAISQCIEALKLQKPGFFSARKRKNEFREKNRIYSDQLQKAILEEREIKGKISEAERQLKKLQDEVSINEIKIKQNQDAFEQWQRKETVKIKQLENEVASLKKRLADISGKRLDFTVDYETLQLSNPWFDAEYRRMQSKLFITALRVRKQFLYENKKNIKAAYLIWSKQYGHLEHKIVISEAWNWMNMVIPVISSTFASFSRMCANLGTATIGHLFIDEAGQALPQASVGAIFRSRYVMAVGDPSQIKPVLTLDAGILGMLGEYYNVSQKYLSEDSSTQTLADAISRYGFYKDADKEEWIGIPLWVHRRCKYPMFDIANKISYGGNMVQGVKEKGTSAWFDITGNAVDKYVAEQGIFLREKIQEMISYNPDIIDREKKDIIYVISPFKNVAYHLAQELNKIGFTRYDEHGRPTNVGTVHTFQGKEAKIVFLVLGADTKSKGAANWAMGTENPNIMNVAATRAKEEFYIIGDEKLYLRLGSDVVNNTYEIIRSFNSAAGN